MTDPAVAHRLASAKEALHQFQIGRRSVKVVVDGREVTYNRTDIDTLEGYVAKLEDEAAGRVQRPSAIAVRFG